MISNGFLWASWPKHSKRNYSKKSKQTTSVDLSVALVDIMTGMADRLFRINDDESNGSLNV